MQQLMVTNFEALSSFEGHICPSRGLKQDMTEDLRKIASGFIPTIPLHYIHITLHPNGTEQAGSLSGFRNAYCTPTLKSHPFYKTTQTVKFIHSGTSEASPGLKIVKFNTRKRVDDRSYNFITVPFISSLTRHQPEIAHPTFIENSPSTNPNRPNRSRGSDRRKELRSGRALLPVGAQNQWTAKSGL